MPCSICRTIARAVVRLFIGRPDPWAGLVMLPDPDQRRPRSAGAGKKDRQEIRLKQPAGIER